MNNLILTKIVKETARLKEMNEKMKILNQKMKFNLDETLPLNVRIGELFKSDIQLSRKGIKYI